MDLGPQAIGLDGKKYELALRFKRDYKPYAIQLIDVRKDDYVGTDTPRNYSSEIRLTDAEHKAGRKIPIWMNNPLRYAGETFYQSGYHKVGNREWTTLQVVKNTGWMIPYLGCMIVVVGMAVQFGLTLLRFVQRRQSEPTAHWTAYAIPAATVIVLGAWLIGQARLPKPVAGQFDFYQFGELPVVYEGRSKPFDTLARNTLRILSGKQYYLDEDGKKQPAVRWLLDLIAEPKVAFRQRVIRIDNPEVLNLLHLTKRDDPKDGPKDGSKSSPEGEKGNAEEKAGSGAKRTGSLYSLSELMPEIRELETQAEKARGTDVHRMTTEQKKMLELDKKTRICTS